MAYIPPRSEPIAIIGRSCRFPGPANSPSRLWELLRKPYDLSKRTPESRFNINGFYHPNGEHHGTTNAAKAYWMDEDPFTFDAPFFSITPKEAETIDPAGKLLLEVVYEGMEASGLTLEGCAGKKIGMFLGLMTADYELLTGKDDVGASQYIVTGTSRPLVSNRVSYFFNWNGPSMTIDTACSSSLVAMHQAVLSLRSGESSMACVAGANVMLSPDTFIIESSLHMLSPNGQSRMWDESADGYARGEGAGCFFLKTLTQALADGDHIECLIRETGANSDGRTMGITMPSSKAQAALIRDTYNRSGLDPRNPAHRCQYFEAHGTGTQAGDPREAEAIHDAFFGGVDEEVSDDDHAQLLVGSIKTVIGHLEGAAGVAGVLKACMALQDGLVPPNLHYHNVNPKVAPFTRRLRVATAATTWPDPLPGQPRRASVNSFGFGGTNAHAILELYEPLIHGGRAPAAASWQPQSRAAGMPVLFSANSNKTLARLVEAHLDHLQQNPETDLTALAGTLAFRRSVLPHKVAFPAAVGAEALVKQMQSKLDALVADPQAEIGTRSKPADQPTRILGIFTGQGAQWPSMGKGLMESCTTFRDCLESLDKVLQSCPDPPPWSIVGELGKPAGESRLDEAAISQPLCTAVQIALVELLKRSGIVLSAVVGHSSGEIGAAYASGSLSARDAILVAYYRGLHAKRAGGHDGSRGSMMAVGMGVDDALDFCSRDELDSCIYIAASNGPASVTLSGDMDAIMRAKEILDEEKRFCRLLKVDTAYHSHHMYPCAAPYLASLEACHIQASLPDPSCPWISSVYGICGTPTAKELTGRYWRDNMVQPVLFSDALTRALTEHGPFDAVLEIGPHPALKGPASQTMQDLVDKPLPYAGVLARGKDDVSAFSEALGMLWCSLGAKAVDLAAYSHAIGAPAESYKRVQGLPSYPWDHSQTHYRLTRLTKQYLHRPSAVHELLGIRTPDETPAEHRWHSILNPVMLPWLEHHRFQGQIIVPATAYCVMAFDAARTMAAEYGKTPQTIEIRDLVIRSGITMEDDTQGVEIMCSLLYDDLQSSENTMVTNFTLSWAPVAGNRANKLAVSGTVAVYTNIDDDSCSTRLPRAFSREENARLNKVNLDEFYDVMQGVGLAYTGPFRALQSMQRRMNFASAELTKPHTEDTCTLPVRPALLDASCQAIFAAFASPGDGALWTSFLPQRIKRMRFNTAICDVRPGEEPSPLRVEATVTCFEPTSAIAQASFSGDIEIFNMSGDMEVQIEGLTVQSFGTASNADDRELYLQTIYKQDPWSGFGLPILPPPTQVDKRLAALCDDIVQFYVTEKLGGVAGSDSLQKQKADKLDAAIALSPYRQHLDLLKACGSAMPALVPGLVKEILQESLEVAAFTQHLSHVVDHISHRHPHINVLEIDLGNPVSLTESVTAGLSHVYASYTYACPEGLATPQVVAQMLQTNARRWSRLDLQKEQPLLGLDAEQESFDLVIISKVADNVDESVEDRAAAVRQLIKPGGFLLTINPQGKLLRDRLLSFLTNSQLSGSFVESSTTPDGRSSNQTKKSPLEEHGFTPPLHRYSSPRAGMSLSVAQATSREVEILRSPAAHIPSIGISGRILLVGGKQPATARIRKRLADILAQCLDCTPILADSLEDVDAADLASLRAAVLLCDLDAPILEATTATRLARLQAVFGPNRYVLWLTAGALRTGANPYHAASVGLARTVKSETPQLRLQFLDCEDGVELAREDEVSSTAIADVVANVFLRLAYAVECEKETPALWTTESEMVLAQGRLQLPRFVPAPEANDRLNSIRRVVARETDVAASTVVELRAIEEGGAETLCARNTHLSPEDLEGGPDRIVVRMLYSSAWALGLGDGSFLFAGLGVTAVDKRKVLLLSPSNASSVSIPRSWTLDINQVALADEAVAAVFVRAMLAQCIVAETVGSAPLVILEADTVFASVMDIVSGAADRVTSTVYPTTACEQANKDSRFIFIHPHASHRVIQSALPAKIEAIMNLRPEARASPVVEAFTSTTRHVPVSQLARLSSQKRLQRTTESCVKDALILSQDVLSSITVWSANNTEESTIHSVAAILGESPQHLVTAIDWTRSTSVTERIQPIDPTTVLSPSKTYLLVGLTGDLGESLCRLMTANGARHFVVASRNPAKAETWAAGVRATGAEVHLASLDAADKQAVANLKQELQSSAYLPLGGVVNGAMLLSDGLFADMTVESLDMVMKPKAVGSQNLSDVFCEPDLDFFLMLSSLTCIGGNSGQSNYTAANMYMAGLAAQRRKRGLCGSVLDIGILYGIGYVNRVDGAEIYKNLKRQGYLPISERDIHHMFVEAIVTGRAGSGAPFQLSTGLQRFNPVTDVPLAWHSNPKFSHHLADKDDVSQSMAAGSSMSVKDLLKRSETVESINENLQKAFAAHLESMLHLPPNSVNKDMPIIDLGIDSLAAVDIRSWFLKEVEKDMPVLKVLGGSSLATLCTEIAVDIFEERCSEAAAAEKDGEEEATQSVAADSDSSLQTPSGLTESDTFTSMQLASSTEFTSEYEEDTVYEQISLMSSNQARMWFPFLLLDDKTTYNCTTSYRLRGSLDVDRYEAAINGVIRKHQIFRTRFYTDDDVKLGEAMQAVATTSPFKLRKVADGDDEVDVTRETELVADHVYDLENGDVFITTLVSHNAEYHTVIFGYHHIIIDGMSWQQFLGEVERFYINPSRSTQQQSHGEYIDFTIKQRAELDSPASREKRAFWKDQFRTLPAPIQPLAMAKSTTRRTLQRYDVSEYFVELDQKLVARLKTVATENKATSFHFYLAALQAMLHRLLGADNVCIGITDANRSDQAYMETIGLMLDSLPLWFHPASDERFCDRLQQTRSHVYTVLGNSGVPLDTILSDAGVETSASHLPLFQVLVNYRMGAFKQKTVGPDVALDFLAYKDARHPFDFIVNIDEEGGRAGLTLSMQNYLYDAAAGQAFLQIYNHFLDAFATAPEATLGEPAPFPQALRQEALRLGEGEALPDDWPATLPERIDDVVARFPDDVAVVNGATECTYRGLSARSDAIAAALVKQTGVSKGSCVGVFAGPSLDAVVSLLAIHRAGAVYVPLDERNSDERLANIVAESSAKAIICTKTTADRVSALLVPPDSVPAKVLNISSIPAPSASSAYDTFTRPSKPLADDLAMIMFTSGSTGKPKGITLSHGNFLTHVHAATVCMGLGREAVLQQSALGYDASLAQTFYALANAGKLVVSSNRGEMGAMADLMVREKVSLTLMAPSEYAVLFRFGGETLKKCGSWRVAMCGGEAFTPALRLSFRGLGLEGLKVVNAYGPTEISVASNMGEVDYSDAGLDNEGRVPIGPSLPGYSVCLVDETTRPVPLGCSGQIAVSGGAVSTGYLNNERLTREKFPSGRTIVLPGSRDSGRRWYLTGDLGRMNADGQVVYLGRIDNDSQIKLRGIRIELAEIANSVLETARGAIAQAVVGVRGEGDGQFLVAYVVFAADGKQPQEPRGYLRQMLATLPLPTYMRPAQAVPLDALPLNPSGKVDMVALSAVLLTADKNPGEPGSRRFNAVEARLKDIWEAVLGHTGIEITKESNFFSAGGNSLLLLKLQAEIRKVFAADIRLRDLFRFSTIEGLAAKIQDSSGSLPTSSVLSSEFENPLDDAIDWAAETALPPAMLNTPITPQRPPPSPHALSVLLTGATGFLGRAIARALQARPEVQQIHCLAVRDPFSPAARALEAACPKAVLHGGDLAAPRLGLGDDEARLLFADAAAVVHNGADVSFLKPYVALRGPNVGATRELLRLCAAAGGGRGVAVHYISTAGVVAVLGEQQSGVKVKPGSLAAHTPAGKMVDGYVASKWASEVLLEHAAVEAGLPVRVYRPSSITGPEAPALDILHTVLGLSREMRAVPDMRAWSGAFDLIRVQTAAKEVVAGVLAAVPQGRQLAAARRREVEYVHLTGEQLIPVVEARSSLERQTGYAFREIEMEAWVREAGQYGLSELVAAYLTSATAGRSLSFPLLESSL